MGFICYTNERTKFLILWNVFFFGADNREKGGRNMKKQEEKKPVPWEMVDPKPPVIQSGHLENRKENNVM